MQNFQLYRTNLILGGQMKWDIVIDSAASHLYVSDFHLSPISNNIAYTYESDENLLNNSHQDNIKIYFNKHKGIFYDEGLDYEFMNPYPTISNKNEITKCYSDVYDMGCKRMSQFKRFNKQFEFLCPIWIEHLDDDLSFKISIRSKNDPDIILAANSISLSTGKNVTHDKFVKYFKDYVKFVGLDNGDDNIANVNFKNSLLSIHGLDASSGLVSTKCSNDFIKNITLRERPLMEVDNMLINEFKSNTLIAKQLFNFNICFNLEDIIPNSIIHIIKGMPLVISVESFIGDNKLEMKDIYTEYDFIPRHIIHNRLNNKYDEDYNVLDYLNDDKCIDMMAKNKFCQKICHWSLSDNEDYIFNLYDGFSGLTIDGDNIIENLHNYANTSDIFTNINNAGQNTTGWINTYYVNTWKEFNSFISNTKEYKKYGSHISNDVKFLNNLKYSKLSSIDPFYVVTLIVNSKLLDSILVNTPNKLTCLYNESLYVITSEDLLILLTDDENNITYNKFYNILIDHDKNDFEDFVDIEYIDSSYDKSVGSLSINDENDENSFDDQTATLYIESNVREDESLYETKSITILEGNYRINETKKKFLKSLLELMKNVIEPSIVTFGGSLNVVPAKGPSNDVKEISYIKDNTYFNYVIRYDGKIRPAFTDKKSTLYYKDYVSDDRSNGKSRLQKSDYAKYIKYGYPPMYPSINYNGFKRINEYNYDVLPKIKVSEYDDEISIVDDKFEYKWFNTSSVLYLVDVIEFKCIKRKISDNEYESLDKLIRENLIRYYNLKDDTLVEYILKKYDIEYDWEYYSDTDISNYVYTIKMKLK